ncbi:MAG: O-antigen ligase family protein [gamma proteobacterium symbiont of Taylorina sp.]|nr:O-antigen ligase family protein [gamma proteobacterium symbiont of Taylorina sp.]
MLEFKKNKLAIQIFLVVGLLIHSAIEYHAAKIHFLNTGIFFFFYGLLFLLALPVIKKMFETFFEHIFLYLMVLWAAASVLWTTNLLETSLAIVSLSGMLLFAFYLAEKFSIEEVFELLIYFCLLSVVINGCVIYFFPKPSMFAGGLWNGVYMHKNGFGVIFYFSSMVLLCGLYFKNSVNKILIMTGFFASLGFLYKSVSVTSWVAVILCFGLFFVKWLQTKTKIQWRWFFLIFSISAVFISLNLAKVVGIFGKNLTFTDRDEIWTKVLDVIQQKLLLGNGYYGFWYDDLHKIPGRFYGIMSHSGFLEIMVFLGVIGFFFFLLMWGRALFLAAKLYFSERMTLETVFPFIFLVVYSIQNSMESLFFLKMNIFTIIFIYCILYVNHYYSNKRF